VGIIKYTEIRLEEQNNATKWSIASMLIQVLCGDPGSLKKQKKLDERPILFYHE
jgi:hypothetical protein